MTFSDRLIDFKVDSSTTELEPQNYEEVSNPLNNYRQVSSESLIVDNSIFVIALVGDKETKSILVNKNFEKLGFHFLFPSGKFGYSCKRQTELSWSKYISQKIT